MARLDSAQALKTLRDSFQAARREDQRRVVSLCGGSGCGAYGTAKVHEALKEELARQGMEGEVLVRLTGCHGFCQKGPMMVVEPEGIFYPQVKVGAIPEIVEKTLKSGQAVDALTYKDPSTKKNIVYEKMLQSRKTHESKISNELA